MMVLTVTAFLLKLIESHKASCFKPVPGRGDLQPTPHIMSAIERKSAEITEITREEVKGSHIITLYLSDNTAFDITVRKHYGR